VKPDNGATPAPKISDSESSVLVTEGFMTKRFNSSLEVLS
jgi:hypothetical protein